MRGFRRCHAGLGRRAAVIWALALSTGPPAWAGQQSLRARVANYPNAPVVLKTLKVQLVELFSTPTQPVIPGTSTEGSRVRRAGTAGTLPSTFVLFGDVLCQNRSAQGVRAVELTVVLLDPFHQPVRPQGSSQAYTVRQVAMGVSRGSTARIAWKQPTATSDVYEVVAVVTRVRFDDGSVWLAPREELIEIF